MLYNIDLLSSLHSQLEPIISGIITVILANRTPHSFKVGQTDFLIELIKSFANT